MHFVRRKQIKLALRRRKRFLLRCVLYPSACTSERGAIELGGATLQVTGSARLTIPVFDEAVKAGRIEHVVCADPFVCGLS